MEINKNMGKASKKDRKATFWAVVLLLAVSGVFLAAGIGNLNEYNRLQTVCTESTEGIVADIEVTVKTDSDGDTETTYKPVFEYAADGRTIRWSDRKASKKRFSVGDKVTVFYNPASPETCYVKGFNDKAAMVNAISGLALGGLFLLAPFALLVKGLRKKREKLMVE